MNQYRGMGLAFALSIVVGAALLACGDDAAGADDDAGAADAAVVDGALPDGGIDAGGGVAYGCEDPNGWTVGLQRVQRNLSTIWNVILGPNATSVTLPELPSIVDPTGFFGTGTLRGQLIVGSIDWQNNVWTKSASARLITLEL